MAANWHVEVPDWDNDTKQTEFNVTLAGHTPRTVEPSLSEKRKGKKRMRSTKTLSEELAHDLEPTKSEHASHTSETTDDTEGAGNTIESATTNTAKDEKKKKRKKKKRRVDEAESKQETVESEPQTTDQRGRTKSKSELSELQQSLRQKLLGSRFRWLNEQLYTQVRNVRYSQRVSATYMPLQDSGAAFKMFQENPTLFDAYHEGFAAQVAQWPTNPVDRAIAFLRTKISTMSAPRRPLRVADFGCGEAKIAEVLSASFPKDVIVHSFDLVARNPRVTACDIRHVPLENDSIDVAVYCLSLMGTNWPEFLAEAMRVVVPGGDIVIAEVASRFANGGVNGFVKAVRKLGMQLIEKDDANKMFVWFHFVSKKTSGESTISTSEAVEAVNYTLKPCVYKKR